MPTAFYDEVFSVPVTDKKTKFRAERRPPIDDLEFSEYGRSADIPAGWYLAPALLIWPLALLLILM